MTLNNKVVSLTGTLPFKNQRAKVILEIAGASVRRDVSGKIDVLVTANNPGKVITAKAERLGIQILPWSKLRLGKHQRALEDLLAGTGVG